MTINLEEAINKSKELLIYGDHNPSFNSNSRGYFTTVECIKEYLQKLYFSKNRALTVLSSGDQIFNLSHAGVREIDAFDINELQYFAYMLRKTLILTVPYQDFIRININFTKRWFTEYLLELIKSLKKDLPEEVYEYYRTLLEYCLKNNISLSGLYFNTPEYFKLGNNYLTSEEEYLKLRAAIMDTEVNIIFSDALNIPKLVNPGYDIILLSNIADYLHFNMATFGRVEFQKYINSFFRLLNSNGVLVNYLYYLNDNQSIIKSTKDIPSDKQITATYLGLENIFKISTPPYTDSQEGYYRVRRK